MLIGNVLMLRKCVCFCTLIALGVPLAAAGDDFIAADSLKQAGLTKFWQLQLPLQSGQELADIYLVDDHLYCTTTDGWVFTLHAHTGVLRWLKPVTTSSYRILRPAHAFDRAVFATTTTLSLYSRLNGTGLLRRETPFPIGSPPASDGRRVFFGGVNHRFYAYDVVSGFEVWKAGTDGRITSRPALLGGLIFVASHAGDVYASNAATKVLAWRARLPGAVSADLAVDENGLYVANENNSLYLFSVTLGRVIWRARFSGPLYEPPITTLETAFQYCADDGLIAVNTGGFDVKERFRWKMPRGRTLLTVDKKSAYVLTRDQSVVVADLADGHVRHTIEAAGFSKAAPSPADGAIYIAAADGRVFCARSRTVPFVGREAIQQAMRESAGEPPPRALTEAPPSAPPRPAGDPFKSRKTGVPIGGKSKVTREFEHSGDGGGNP